MEMMIKWKPIITTRAVHPSQKNVSHFLGRENFNNDDSNN